MIVISAQNAEKKHDIKTFNSLMENGEYRFRLIKGDGTAYIRTESQDDSGWQESHYHKYVMETYIVQSGWIAYAELVQGNPEITFFVSGDVFTTKPNIAHNVYMSKYSVIHTVKHGTAHGDDRFTDGLEQFDKACKSYDSDALAYLQSTKSGKKSLIQFEYGDQYNHFDNLIWKVPAWATALFALAIGAVGSGGLTKISNLVGLDEPSMVALFLFIMAYTLLTFSNAMHRFRYHQIGHKLYSKTSFWRSASSLTQLAINSQVGLMIMLGLVIIKLPIAVAVTMGIILICLLTIWMETAVGKL